MSPDDPVFDETEVYCTCGHLDEDHVEYEAECTKCECTSFKPQKEVE